MEDKIYALVKEFYGEFIRDISKDLKSLKKCGKEEAEDNRCYDSIYVTEMEFSSDGDLVENVDGFFECYYPTPLKS